ncbi:MAG: hypothetical protein LC789_18755 [Actinobacteria bacterium]|nr:hypothetical protein [Actinomycetota bacterium]
MPRSSWLLVLALPLALTSCGGGGNGGGGGTGGDGRSEADDGGDRDDDGGTTTGAAGTGDYCRTLKEAQEWVQEQFAGMSATEEPSAEQTKAFWEGIYERYHALADEAPDQVADDYALLVAAFDEMFPRFREASYDASKLSEADQGFLNSTYEGTPKLKKADEAIDEYNEKECGLET